MMKYLVELYRHYFKLTFGFEPEISKNFQFYYSLQKFFSRYTRNTKTFVYYSVKPGIKIIAELSDDYSEKIDWLGKKFIELQKIQDTISLKSIIASYFELAKKAKKLYIEIIRGDVAIRIRFSRPEEAKTALERALRLAASLA